MKRLFFYASVILMAVTVMSCSNDEANQARVNLKFTPDNSVSSISAARLQSNSLEFTSGYIKLRSVQFEAEADETDSIEVDWEQLVVIDFATGTTNPDISSLVFPLGTYTAIEVELELLDENNVPSVVIEGTFTDNSNQTHPIRFEFNSGETFEVEKEGTIVFAEDASVLAEVKFDPATWFLGVTSENLEGAIKNENGVIVISENSNSSIFEIVADGLDMATEVEITM